MLKIKTKKQKQQSYEATNEIKKLSVFVTIVNHGLLGPVMKIMQNAGVSAQFVQTGSGTATDEVLDILGIEDRRKNVILSLISQENIPNLKSELSAFFAINKRNKGIGFSIPLTSIIGIKVYQFLANAI